MSNSELYCFDSESFGSFELELTDTNRSFYKPKGLVKMPFRIFGLLQYKDAVPFYFFEWQKVHYSYVVECSSSLIPPLELRINNRTINYSKERANNHLLTGQFSFDDEVGETKIEIRDHSNKMVFGLNTEVFPQKMDYKSDYNAMMAEITEIIQNLAYDSLKDTFRKSKAKLKGQPTENEWWNILDALFEQLVSNLGVIKRLPKHEIRSSEKIQPIEKIKSASRKNIDWFRKNSQYSNHSNEGLRISPNKYFSHALSNNKHITYDTYENRFIAWAIRNIIEQLRQYKDQIENIPNSKDYSSLIKRMKMYQGLLQGVLHENPFNEVGDFEKRAHFSTSLTRGAGYRDFMHIYLLLSRGLEIADNDIFKIEQKNISTLYEYWCFLKLVRLLKDATSSDIDYQDLIKIKAGKVKVELEKGQKSKVVFKKNLTQESTTIYFNREFKKDNKKIFTYAQRPDYSIKFMKNGFDKPFWYIFDAKYRFNEDKSKEMNFYDVPQDAIGQLHRYRDAILHTEPTDSTYRSAIKNLGGIILYPYPLSEDDFFENNYYKSIEQVNIGALPFLPSKSNLVTNLLNELINKRLPEEHFEQFIEMDKTEYLDKRMKWNEWVAVGLIQKENQEKRINFLYETNIFHFPFVKNTESRLYLSKRLMVCISGTNDTILYDIEKWEIMTDKELGLLGTSWTHRSDKYLSFRVTNKRLISSPDRIIPINIRYVNSGGLDLYLRNKILNRHYLFLTNHDALILFNEFTNRNYIFDVRIHEKDIDVSEFTISELKILSSNKFPNLHYKMNDEILSLNLILDLLSINDKNYFVNNQNILRN